MPVACNKKLYIVKLKKNKEVKIMTDKYERIKQCELLRKRRKTIKKVIPPKKIRSLTIEEKKEAIALIEEEFECRKKNS